MTEITTFLGTAEGKAVLGALAFAIGFFTKSGVYRKLRGAYGRMWFGIGIGISVFGRTRLKVIWNPAENVFNDLVIFPIEELAAGTRAGKIERIEEHVHRLEDVRSETRKNALEEKLAVMKDAANPPPPSEPTMEILKGGH